VTFSAGQTLTADALNTAFAAVTTLFAVSSADQNVGPSNTTLQNVTDLAVSVAAGAVYEFRLDLQYSTNTTADIKIGFTFPVGLTMDYALLAFNTSETWVTSRGSQTTVLSLGGTGTVVVLAGTVTVGSTAGTLQLQAAQATSTAVATTVEQGSLLVLKRLS